MRNVKLAKVDQKGNHIPDDSTPTIEELRRDFADGTRVLEMQQTHMNELLVGEDPNGNLDGDKVRAILAEAAPTNIHAQVALEAWDARNNAESKHTVAIGLNENGLPSPRELKAAVEKAISSVPRQVRRATRVDPVKVTVAFNLAMHSVDLSAEDYKSKIRSLADYAFGELDWDELEAELEGRQCVRGEWKKSRIATSDNQTRH